MSTNLPEQVSVYKARSSGNRGTPLPRLGLRKVPGLSGGEGAIYTIPNEMRYCAKIFRRCSGQKAAKLQAFIPFLQRIADTYIPGEKNGRALKWSEFLRDYVAYPRTRLYRDERGNEIVGYMMNYFDPDRIVKLEDLIHRPAQDGMLRLYTYVLYELIMTVSLLYSIGISPGDIDESNILVRRKKYDNVEGTRLILIDIDSAQLKVDGTFYKNDAWHPDTTAPEISRHNERVTTASLVFSLSVIIYKTLMGGLSPFQFVQQRENDGRCKQLGLSPLRDSSLQPPAGRNVDVIPVSLRRLLAAGIDPDIHNRPGFEELALEIRRYYEEVG